MHDTQGQDNVGDPAGSPPLFAWCFKRDCLACQVTTWLFLIGWHFLVVYEQGLCRWFADLFCVELIEMRDRGSGGFVGPGEQWWLLFCPHLILMQNWASLNFYLPTLHLLGCKYVLPTWNSLHAPLIQFWTFCKILMRKHPLDFLDWAYALRKSFTQNKSTLLYKLIDNSCFNSTATVLFCQLIAQLPWWWHCEQVNQWRFCFYIQNLHWLTCSRSSG